MKEGELSVDERVIFRTGSFGRERESVGEEARATKQDDCRKINRKKD